MAGMIEAAESMVSKYADLRPHLDERQRRLLLGVEAQQLGRGEIKAVAAGLTVRSLTKHLSANPTACARQSPS